MAANSTIIDYLVNMSRSFIFSTALSPADIGAALAALHIFESDTSVSATTRQCELYGRFLNSMGIYATNETPIFQYLSVVMRYSSGIKSFIQRWNYRYRDTSTYSSCW